MDLYVLIGALSGLCLLTLAWYVHCRLSCDTSLESTSAVALGAVSRPG